MHGKAIVVAVAVLAMATRNVRAGGIAMPTLNVVKDKQLATSYSCKCVTRQLVDGDPVTWWHRRLTHFGRPLLTLRF